ncbi:MAG: T9SS type A sorting domain-containing protein [Flavobacteriales bacterium]|nr:T9SS type A sorting domain-containing protein [Flavobacteriales bacterium]
MRKSYFLLLILVFSTYNLRASMSPEPVAVLPAGHAMLGGGGPDNDLCSSVTAVALSVDSTLTFTGDNTAATFDGDAVEGSVLFQFPFANTWHAFTTTECTNVTVSYCATDSGWSNVWRLLTTQCPAESEINASSSDTTTCANGNWTFTFNELEPGTYYLPVPNVGFGQGGGPYQIELSAASCGNDDQGTDLCSDAVPQQLSVGATLNLSGDNSTATFAGDAVEGSVLFQYPSANTWHAFTTTECTNVTVSYCATDSGWSNVWRLLTTQCPAESEINASSSDTTTCTNGNWTFTFNELEPGTYYLPVPNVGFGQGGGPYQIELSAASCANENQGTDLCSDVIPEDLPVDTTLIFVGDNTDATFDGDAELGNVMSQYPSPNTWHAFTTTECSNVTVSYCSTDSGWSNIWSLLTMYCPADSLINASFSDTTSCANGNWTFSFDQLAAGTYYLPVPNVGFGQGGGAYSIEVSAISCTVGVGIDITTSTDWQVFPNPTTGDVSISTPNTSGPADLVLMDMTGRAVLSQQVVLKAGGTVQLSLDAHIASGTYLLQMTTVNSRSSQRLIVR